MQSWNWVFGTRISIQQTVRFSPGFFGNVTEIQLREFQKYNQECEINTHEKFGKYSFKAMEEEREKAEVTFPEWSVNLSG